MINARLKVVVDTVKKTPRRESRIVCGENVWKDKNNNNSEEKKQLVCLEKEYREVFKGVVDAV